MKTHTSYNNLILFSILVAGLLLLSAVFVLPAYAAENNPTEEQIDAALRDLSETIGQTVGTKEVAVQICDSEKYFTTCADIGKKHNLYTPEEVAQVDNFVNEIKGDIASQLQSCNSTECLINVANQLAQRINEKNPALATSLDLTPNIVEKKQAVIAAAREIGVNIDDCYKMDPDTAPVELLRACARLAKDKRSKDIVPEDIRESVDALGSYADKTVDFRSSLVSGEFQCGNGTMSGCGNYCLNPSPEVRAQGASAIPPVCLEVARKFFGPEGEEELKTAYSKVAKTQDLYFKKAESIVFKTIDGRALNSLEAIGNYMENQGKQGNVEAVEKGMNFMIAKGFIQPEEKEYALKFVRQIRNSGGIPDFDICARDPKACRDFIPEDERSGFDLGLQIDQIMRAEIGFDPMECDRGQFDPAIGEKCFEGTKRALPKLEALVATFPEANFVINDIKMRIADGEKMMSQKMEVNKAFMDQGGPGGCGSEQECFTFCSIPENTPECIAFGAKQGIFQGDEAVQKFQQFNNSLQTQQLPTNLLRQMEQNQFQQNVQRGITIDSFGQGGSFPGQGPYPEFIPPGQGYGIQNGYAPGTGPNYGGYNQGPSPECFDALRVGDFARAKQLCDVSVAPVKIETRIIPGVPSGPQPTSGMGIVCPMMMSADSCPAGYNRVVSFSSPECGTYYSCKPQVVSTYSPPPTQTQRCVVGSYYDFSYGRCLNEKEACTLYGGKWDEVGRYCRMGSAFGSCRDNLIKSACFAQSGCAWFSDQLDNYCENESYFPPPTGTCPVGFHYHSESGGFCMNSQENYSGVCFGPAGKSQIPCPASPGMPYPLPGSGSSCYSISLQSVCRESNCVWYENHWDGTHCDDVAHGQSGGPYPTGSPYPTSGASYTPMPSCPPDRWWDNARDMCVGSADSCGSGYYWDTMTNICQPTTSGATYTPYPSCAISEWWDNAMNRCTSSSATYTPYPASTCAIGQWWDSAMNSCISSTPTYTPVPSCPSGAWWDYAMNRCSTTSTSSCGVGYYWDTMTNICQPTTSGSGSCPSGYHYHSESGGFCMNSQENYSGVCYNASGTSTITCPQYTYTPMPSCPSGEWWDSAMNSCISSTPTYTPVPSCPSGQWWDYAMNACRDSSTTYTPYPTCPIDQWWDTMTSSCQSSSTTGTTYSPPPTTEYYPPTTSYIPPTTSYIPPTTIYSPPPTTSYIPPTTSYIPPTTTLPPPVSYREYQVALANAYANCAESGGEWIAPHHICVNAGEQGGFFANVIRVFSKFLRVR